ncbi:DUF7144 family membrane protein [Micromonospora carbonacea]|uniref:DUF7144 domain-containing protein n=1 Tax=Micromonospora carbonacea TaxID=47853 RepID=A0A1C4ZQB8_9ACTN|nr:hypothetical protein [Micromonospora carbonacea]SCF34996.1 hypothetical protein GA0070563_10994 [Micromonospora carbonacea]
MRGQQSEPNGPAPRRAGGPDSGAGPDDRRSGRLVAGLLLGVAGAIDASVGASVVRVDPYVVVDEGFRRLDVTGWAWLQLAAGLATVAAALALTVNRRATVLAAAGAGSFDILLTVLLFPYHPVERALSALLAAVAVCLLAGCLRAAGRRRPAAPGGRGIS